MGIGAGFCAMRFPLTAVAFYKNNALIDVSS